MTEEYKYRLIVRMVRHAFLGGAIVDHVGTARFRVGCTVCQPVTDIAVFCEKLIKATAYMGVGFFYVSTFHNGCFKPVGGVKKLWITVEILRHKIPRNCLAVSSALRGDGYAEFLKPVIDYRGSVVAF